MKSKTTRRPQALIAFAVLACTAAFTFATPKYVSGLNTWANNLQNWSDPQTGAWVMCTRDYFVQKECTACGWYKRNFQSEDCQCIAGTTKTQQSAPVETVTSKVEKTGYASIQAQIPQGAWDIVNLGGGAGYSFKYWGTVSYKACVTWQ